MNDNNFFQFNRFARLFLKDARGLWPHYGLSMLILSLIPTMAVWLCGYSISGSYADISPDMRRSLIFYFVFLVACIAPSRLYRSCNLPQEGIYFAMLPASTFEKYLSMLLYCLFICPLLAFCVMTAVDSLLSLLPFGPYHQYLWDSNSQVSFVNVGSFHPPLISLCGFFAYLFHVLIFLFTATIFKRHKVTKTFLWLVLITFAISIIGAQVFSHFAQDILNWLDGFETTLSDDEVLGFVCNIVAAVNAAFSALLLWWTYYRLKHMKY